MMGFLLARNLNRSYALFRGKSMPKGQSEENSVELISNEETFFPAQVQILLLSSIFARGDGVVVRACCYVFTIR